MPLLPSYWGEGACLLGSLLHILSDHWCSVHKVGRGDVVVAPSRLGMPSVSLHR